MRPIRLVAQAFGPFADRIEIDFRPALSQRLFGIYGPTGAGKTTVLDAIAYALFGVSSGGERTRAQLRSDLADLETETFVEFIFELGEKRYFVLRKPEQELRSARKDSRTFLATAVVYDASDIPPDAINLENPGRLLGSRKVREVDEILSSLLGYNADQFRQVVMLPQGRFRDLLTAGSDERSQILRGLFDVSVFERVAESLKNEAAALEAEARTAQQELETRLGDLGVSSLEALAAMIAGQQETIAGQKAGRDRLETARLAAEAALSAGRELATRFAEAAEARAQVAYLEAQADVIAAARRRLGQAQAARELVPFDTAAERATAQAAALAEAVEALEAEAEGARIASEAAEAKAAVSRQEAPQRLALQQGRERAQQIRQRWLAAEPLAAALVAARSDLSSARTAEQVAALAAEQAQTEFSSAEDALAEARSRSGAAAALELSLERLRQSHAIAAAHEAQAALADERTTALASAEALLETASEEARVSHDHLVRLREQLDAQHALQLATDLNPGEPCPVCGSREHPQPARGHAEDSDLLSDLRLADVRALQAQRDVTEARAKAAEAQALSKDAMKVLAGLRAPDRPAQALAQEILAAAEELAWLAAEPDLSAAEERRGAAADRLAAARRELAEAVKTVGQRDGAAQAAEARIVTELATVPDELRSGEAVEQHLISAQAAEQTAIEAHAAAESRATTAAQALAVVMATLVAKRAEAAREANKARTAAAEFASALAGRGLTSEAYAAAAADISQAETLAESVATHQEALAAAADRLARAAQAIEGCPAPDLDELTQTKDEASAAVEAVIREIAAAETELTAWSQAQARIAEAEARRREAQAAFQHVGELARLVLGRNPLRLSLVDYAIAAYFEDVLAAANLRFRRMSEGRFELRRKSLVDDQRRSAGLEILVFDSHSGRERDARTLSGGEGFMAALALALGLSDVVQAESGGVKLDAIFIDEGFGHLDEQSLERALDTLRDLVGEARAVGVISHVDAVKAQIPAGFEVMPQLRGSRILPRALAIS